MRLAVPDSSLPLSPDSYCARCTRAIAPRKLFASPRAMLTSPVRARTSPARARINVRSACACALRCFTGYSNSGSIRANRASVCASRRSSFLRLSPISRTLRAFATITSCPNSLSIRLIQGECVPISSAMRLRGIVPKTSCNAFAVVRTRCSNSYLPGFIHHAVPTVAVSQIQSNGQFLLRKILALLRCCGANLLHCRSPFYLCLEHVDNLGAYSIPSGDRPSHPI